MQNKDNSYEELGIDYNEIVKLENPFIDERGEIQPLVDSLMKSAVLIHSKNPTIQFSRCRCNIDDPTDCHCNK